MNTINTIVLVVGWMTIAAFGTLLGGLLAFKVLCWIGHWLDAAERMAVKLSNWLTD